MGKTAQIPYHVAYLCTLSAAAFGAFAGLRSPVSASITLVRAHGGKYYIARENIPKFTRILRLSKAMHKDNPHEAKYYQDAIDVLESLMEGKNDG